MPESSEHMILVKELIQWTNIYFKNKKALIYSDSPEAIKKPEKIGIYIPDLFAKNITTGEILIGEAKRISDLTKAGNYKRAICQLEEFVNFLAIHGGGIMLMAVPLYARSGFESLIIDIINKHKCKNIQYRFTRSWKR
jgi:hypothetical protein